MSSQTFAAQTDFEVLDRYKDRKGFFIKSFLISDRLNANRWRVTWDAIRQDFEDFLGKPGLFWINPENKPDHPPSKSALQETLQSQEQFRVADIIDVGLDESTKKAWQVSEITDDKIIDKIKKGEIHFISPAVWPKSIDDVEIKISSDGRHEHILHRFNAMHYAFVSEPAFGKGDAFIKGTCTGEGELCNTKLQMVSAAIYDDEIDSSIEDSEQGPLREPQLIIKKTKDTSACKCNMPKTSDKQQTSSATHTMQANQEITQEELKKLKDENSQLKSKLSQMEEDKKETEKNAKKGQTEEEKKEDKEARKAQDEEDKEKQKQQEAKIASLENKLKEPIVEKILTAQVEVGQITSDKVAQTKTEMMKASLDNIESQWRQIEPFVANLNILKSEDNFQTKVPLHLGMNNNFVASSYEDATDEELLEKAGLTR